MAKKLSAGRSFEFSFCVSKTPFYTKVTIKIGIFEEIFSNCIIFLYYFKSLKGREKRAAGRIEDAKGPPF